MLDQNLLIIAFNIMTNSMDILLKDGSKDLSTNVSEHIGCMPLGYYLLNTMVFTNKSNDDICV